VFIHIIKGSWIA